MKSSQFTRLLAAPAVAVLLFACSSAPKQEFSAAPSNPSGKGTVQVTTDPNKNTRLDIEVKHLAPPERMSYTAKTYVVWAAPVANPESARNLGALNVDKNLNGTLSALTSLSTFELFITPEPNSKVDSPSGERLMWTQIHNRKVG